MRVKQSITVQVPVSRTVTETVKGENGQETQVTKTLTEMKEQQREVEVDVPDAPEPTKDQFVNQQMDQYKSLSQERQAQEQADLEQVYDQADKSKDGKIDLSEFDALVTGTAEHKVDAESRQTLDGARISKADDTSPRTYDRSKSSNERTLLQAEAALANLPADDPKRTEYEAKVKQLQTDFQTTYGDRAAPLQAPEAAPQAPAAPPAGKTHEVAAGNTLNKIARENGVTLDDLKAANPDIFKSGKDANGRQRTAGGDLIYPGDQIKIPAKETPEIKAAKADVDRLAGGVSPDRPTGGSPDRLAEQQQRDQTAVTDAKAALGKIPSDDPKRGEYEQKVKDLEATVGAKWMTDEAGQQAIAAEKTINEVTAKLPPPGSEVGKTAPNQLDVNVAQLDKALTALPEGTPGRENFVAQVEAYKKAVQAARDPGAVAAAEAEGIKTLQQDFDTIAGGDGKVSKEDLQKNMPDGPGKDALLKNFDVLKYGTIESGRDAYTNLARGDIDRLAGAMNQGKTIDAVASDIAAQNPQAKTALDQVKKQEASQNVDKQKAEVEATLGNKAGHEVKIEWADDMSDGDKLKQLAMLQKMANDPSYDNTWKQFDKIALDVYESRTDSGDPDNLDGYVETEGKTLKINQPGNGFGGGSDLTDVELGKQVRGMEQLRDKTNREVGTSNLESELETTLSRKAGRAVKIEWAGGMSDEDKLKQLNNLKGMLDDPSYDKMWASYDKVEFNTFEDRRDSGDSKNLTDYVQVDGGTLKLNNAGKDGLTDVEEDKQRRAMEHLRDNGKPFGK